MTPDGPVLHLLELEARAARLEGLFAADPELGAMWRSAVALSEACRSVGLEDIHVFEGDVIHRRLENRATDAESARGAEAVTGLLRILTSPGDLARDTEAVLTRCGRAAVSVAPDGPAFDAAALAGPVRQALSTARSPLLGALRATIVFRRETGARVPSADRLVFMVAEHALRGAGARDGAPGWICTPSAALSQGGFRAWSPGTPAGLGHLLEGLGRELDRGLGQVPVLRRWRAEAGRIAESRTARSRLRDLVRLAAREPILTAPYLRETLGVSPRACFTLMDAAEAEGILTLITPRSSWRVWARPDMAARLAMRTRRPPRGATPGAQSADLGAGLAVGRAPRADAPDDGELEALDALDTAMARADAVLARYLRDGDV